MQPITTTETRDPSEQGPLAYGRRGTKCSPRDGKPGTAQCIQQTASPAGQLAANGNGPNHPRVHEPGPGANIPVSRHGPDAQDSIPWVPPEDCRCSRFTEYSGPVSSLSHCGGSCATGLEPLQRADSSSPAAVRQGCRAAGMGRDSSTSKPDRNLARQSSGVFFTACFGGPNRSIARLKLISGPVLHSKAVRHVGRGLCSEPRTDDVVWPRDLIEKKQKRCSGCLSLEDAEA